MGIYLNPDNDAFRNFVATNEYVDKTLLIEKLNLILNNPARDFVCVSRPRRFGKSLAEAFDILHKTGKVRHFGVSNVPPMQLQLLKKFVKQPLVFNQLQFSLEQSQLIDQTLYVNNLTTERSIDRDNGTLDYCRLHDITIQAWSPLQHGFFKGCFVDSPDFPEMNKVLGELGEKYGVSKTAIAIAWILRHPAKMQAIAGTMNPEHLKEICDATKVELTHNEWYKLYLSSGKTLP